MHRFMYAHIRHGSHDNQEHLLTQNWWVVLSRVVKKKFLQEWGQNTNLKKPSFKNIFDATLVIRRDNKYKHLYC